MPVFVFPSFDLFPRGMVLGIHVCVIKTATAQHLPNSHSLETKESTVSTVVTVNIKTVEKVNKSV